MWPLSAARENHAARLTGNLRGALGFRFKAMGVRSACRAAQLGRQQDLCHAEASGEVLARITVIDHAIVTR
jgi:hypothetical protein